MLRLKSANTSLYKLVCEYQSLPPLRRTHFTKAFREPDYWLEWWDAGGLFYKAFFSTCGGQSLLSIACKEFCGPEISRAVYGLELPELQKRDMVEEFAQRKSRQQRGNGK